MWGNLDLNQRPTGYESAALTAELLPQKTTPKVYQAFKQMARSVNFLLHSKEYLPRDIIAGP